MTITDPNKRQAQRWKYHAPIKISDTGPTPTDGEILSISKSGVLFHCAAAFEVGTIITIAWTDPEAGSISASFSVRTTAKAKERDGFYTRSRFYQVDPQSKRNILTILKGLQSLKQSAQTLSIASIKEVVIANACIFQDFRNNKTQENPALHTLLQQIPQIALSVCVHPKGDFERGLQNMHIHYIQLSLTYAWLTNTSPYTNEAFSYCMQLVKNISENYLALENHDLASLHNFTPPTKEEQEQDTDDPHQQEQLELREKQILIYKSVSNGTFDLAKKIVEWAKEKTWIEHLSNTSPESILTAEAQAQTTIDYFYTHVDVTAEHISDIDMVLTRSNYELNQQEAAEKETTAFTPKVDLGNKKTVRNLGILAVLFCIFIVAAWQSLLQQNYKSKYDDALAIPGLKITKIYKSDSTLLVYVKTKDGNPLTRDHPSISAASKNIYIFLESHPQFHGVGLFTHKNVLVKMFPKKIT